MKLKFFEIGDQIGFVPLYKELSKYLQDADQRIPIIDRMIPSTYQLKQRLDPEKFGKGKIRIVLNTISFEVPQKIIEYSQFLSPMQDDTGINDPIEIPDHNCQYVENEVSIPETEINWKSYTSSEIYLSCRLDSVIGLALCFITLIERINKKINDDKWQYNISSKPGIQKMFLYWHKFFGFDFPEFSYISLPLISDGNLANHQWNTSDLIQSSSDMRERTYFYQ